MAIAANHIHQSIAQQIDHMKPGDLTPGVDIGMAPLNETTLLVRVLPAQPNDARSLDAHITLDQGRDLYDVTIFQRGEKQVIEGVFCDSLGELVFGEDAEPWTQAFGGIQILDADGNVVEERTF